MSLLIVSVSVFFVAAVAGAAQSQPVGENGALLVLPFGSGPELHVLEPGSRRTRRIPGVAPLDDVLGGGAAWSPDGSRIAVTTRTGVFILDLRARRPTLFERGASEPAWSPDGSRVAYVEGSWIWIKHVGGRARRFAMGSRPAWSPDGSRIAFSRKADLLAKRLAGGEQVLLRGGDTDFCVGGVAYTDPDWSPTGAIAYTAGYDCVAPGGGACCYLTRIGVLGYWTGVLPRKGSNEGGQFKPIWSPDGTALAFSQDFGGAGEEIGISRRGRISTRLRGDWMALDWQPLCTIRGTRRADRVRGRPSADLVCGFRGDDRIGGGGGTDRLFGGDGDDRIGARDSAFDVVGCGTGRDSVIADAGDLVGLDCERVVRR